jgi:hypothetical protein
MSYIILTYFYILQKLIIIFNTDLLFYAFAIYLNLISILMSKPIIKDYGYLVNWILNFLKFMNLFFNCNFKLIEKEKSYNSKELMNYKSYFSTI